MEIKRGDVVKDRNGEQYFVMGVSGDNVAMVAVHMIRHTQIDKVEFLRRPSEEVDAFVKAVADAFIESAENLSEEFSQLVKIAFGKEIDEFLEENKNE